MSARWKFTAQFETHEQAKQAATMLRALQPVFLHITYSRDDGGPIRPCEWEEYTRGYPPDEAHV